MISLFALPVAFTYNKYIAFELLHLYCNNKIHKSNKHNFTLYLRIVQHPIIKKMTIVKLTAQTKGTGYWPYEDNIEKRVDNWIVRATTKCILMMISKLLWPFSRSRMSLKKIKRPKWSTIQLEKNVYVPFKYVIPTEVRIQRHVPRCSKVRGLVNGPPSSEVFRSIWTNCLKSYVTIKKENGSSINQ